MMTPAGVAARKGKGQHSTEVLSFESGGRRLEVTAGKANKIADNFHQVRSGHVWVELGAASLCRCQHLLLIRIPTR